MNTEAHLPNFDDRKQMWESVAFNQCKTKFPHAERYIRKLRNLYSNGAVEFMSFGMPKHRIWDWYSSRNQYHELGFFKYFWCHSDVVKHFPHKLDDINFFDMKVFNHSSPYVLGGELAWILVGGGAYKQFKGQGNEAKKIGEEAAAELIDDNYDQVLVYHSGSAWCSFFYDVAWDHSFVVFDQRRHLIHVILATDTD